MANPKFRNINDATDEYTWDTLNLQPDPPVASARDFQSYEQLPRDATAKVVDVWPESERRVWECTWICDETQMRELRKWFEYGAFILFPDAGEATTYNVVWMQTDFQPKWLPGGKYELKATLQEVQ